jgi:hypothetical protein
VITPEKRMNARCFFVCRALLSLLLFVHSANAGGAYQRTKDGKARVWNNNPQPGDAATWSGDRNAQGYATGHGTLTWYTTERKKVTGSNLPSAKYTVISLYSGNMVRGKLDGPVENVSAHGKIFHATFADGRKASDWTAGPAPAPSPTGIALDQRRNEPGKEEAVLEAPAEGPKPSAIHPPSQSESAIKQPTESVSTSAVMERPSPTIDDSLRSLIGPSPVSASRMDAVAEASPPASMPPPAASSPPPVTSTSSSPPPVAGPRLTAAEVIALADAEARRQGYNPSEYQRPQTEYIAAEETWSVSYHQMYADGASKRFTMSVEDKTKKASFAAGR